jgi:para-aminobenzoate synthetase/4-amino-4-deoxychorismate lyase
MLSADPCRPFVLLDDARDGGVARLYRDAREIVAGPIGSVLDRLRAARANGLHAAGMISFEAGYTLEPGLTPDSVGEQAWFGLFDRYEIVDPVALLPDPAGAHASRPRPRIERAAYLSAVRQVQDLIAAGDIYQANLTFATEVRFAGDPLALYASLRQRARAGWGGVVWTGTRWLLSFSPELFFTLEQGLLRARPMKGTAARCDDPRADVRAAEDLARDPKQRAENLMIVDLLRNDLARVAVPGSVAVPELFTVETYPTIHQMTSTVTARLAPGLDALDVIAATFPCGSVTGAPKIRAMEVIARIEGAPRGAYTGSIGRIDPDGDAAFNVAIRTLEIEGGACQAVFGLGSGIVADSQSGDEWAECLAKGAFVTAAQRRFDLFETMRFEAEEGIGRLEFHLARLARSAHALGFACDHHAIRNQLQAATFRLREAARVRLMLSASGAVAIAISPLPGAPGGFVEVALAPLPVPPADFRLRHKTTDRGFYDAARHDAGTFEAMFVDAEGFITEGSFTNVFVERDGRLLTPPLARGLLPGVLRAALIEEGRAVERDLRVDDLAGGFMIGNALRGLIAARLAIDGSRMTRPSAVAPAERAGL